jgi:hypothetical protein
MTFPIYGKIPHVPHHQPVSIVTGVKKQLRTGGHSPFSDFS